MSPAGASTPPPGLHLRSYRPGEDLAPLVEIMNAENEADRVPERETTESLAAAFGHPSDSFDPARDVIVAELEGRAVGVAGHDWVDARSEPERSFRLWGAVHPDVRRRGIGTALLTEQERRARHQAAAMDDGRRPILAPFAGHDRPGAALLERHGYTVARWFLEMVRPHLDDIEDVQLPAGFELRGVTREHYPILWRANREAFRDHWGGSDESEAAMTRFFDRPDADPALWLIAWEGDEIAAGVLNTIHPHENAALGVQRGWLDSVFTRRAWRRRGLARALISQSLLLLRERGMTSAALGVDADNPTGALGLYEDAGFEVDDRFMAFRKPMDADAA
ncbi:MAG: GNAT family N-acetyltransferase [Chloroflexi bacterium]|nr:GNAT family N-acetyltransferase [Chloroflexota bacterium]